MSQFVTSFVKQYKPTFDKYDRYIKDNDWTVEKSRSEREASWKIEEGLIKSILNRLIYFVKKAEGDMHFKKTQEAIDMMKNVIDNHFVRVDTYVQTEDITEYTDKENIKSEIDFQDKLFSSIVVMRDKMSTLPIDNSFTDSLVVFFDQERATLPMREVVENTFFKVKTKVETLQVDWNINTSKELFINMNPKDIPPYNPNKHYWEQDLSTLQFWQEEYNKMKDGININGFHFHPWLYFHSNFFKAKIPISKEIGDKIRSPFLRDNEWYFIENYEEAKREQQILAITGSRRFSKALRNDQLLHYTDGSERPIGEARIGDEIYGSDGKPTKVTIVSPQGKVDIYKVEFLDGRVSYCCEDHLWTVFDDVAKREKVLPLKELINSKWSYTRSKNWNGFKKNQTVYKYFIPYSEPVQYTERSLQIDPYLLGVWLGDGHTESVAVSTIDEPIKDFLKGVSKKYGIKYTEYKIKGTKAITAKLTVDRGRKNKLYTEFKNYNLLGNKHIPEDYLKASVGQRMELLRGMMDTDGTIAKTGGGISYTTVSEVLAKDFQTLCLSLGIACHKKFHTGAYEKKDGTLSTHYIITLFTNKDIFKLERKLERIDNNPTKGRLTKMKRVAITNIEKVGFEEATCIRVNNRRREFLTNNFIVTHNTTTISSANHWTALIVPNAECLIAGGSKKDLGQVSKNLKLSLNNIEHAFRVPLIKKDWADKAIIGLKSPMHTHYEQANIHIINLDKGGKLNTELLAGFTPDFFVLDEYLKFPFLEALEGAKPAFQTPYGWRCVPILTGTGGNEDLSQDALKMLSNPKAYDVLPMNWDRLDNISPPKERTWKRGAFGTFVPAQMSVKDGLKKVDTTMAEYLKIDDEFLAKIEMQVTNWEEANKVIKADRDKKESQPDAIRKEKIYYPIDTDEIFLSGKTNPFPTMEAKKVKDRLVSEGNVGKPVDLYRDHEGKVKYELSNKTYPLFPYPGGFHDSPVTIYEEPPENPDTRTMLYVAGLDDYKHEASDGDSLGSFVIHKRTFTMGEWDDRIVASYHSRPDPHSEFHRIGLMLLEMYGAMCFPENEDMDFKTYLDKKHLTDKYLLKGVNFLSEFNLNVNNNREYGWQPTTKNKRNLLGQAISYTKEEHDMKDEDGTLIQSVLGVNKIPDIKILDEIIHYKEGGNYDGLTAWMSALGYVHYLDSTYQTPSPPRNPDDIKRPKPKPYAPFGRSRYKPF